MTNILNYFLNKNIEIKAQGFKLSGKLVSFQDSSRDGHLPEALIIENSDGKHVLRSSGGFLFTINTSSSFQRRRKT